MIHCSTYRYRLTSTCGEVWFTVGYWPSQVNTGDTKKRELLKNPTKIEEIQEKKKLLTEIEPSQLVF